MKFIKLADGSYINAEKILKFFVHIVAASETVEEFNAYWKEYFRGDKQ